SDQWVVWERITANGENTHKKSLKWAYCVQMRGLSMEYAITSSSQNSWEMRLALAFWITKIGEGPGLQLVELQDHAGQVEMHARAARLPAGELFGQLDDDAA